MGVTCDLAGGRFSVSVDGAFGAEEMKTVLSAIDAAPKGALRDMLVRINASQPVDDVDMLTEFGESLGQRLDDAHCPIAVVNMLEPDALDPRYLVIDFQIYLRNSETAQFNNVGEAEAWLKARRPDARS